jgi:small redox-active disulfide protein 2
MNIEILGMGCTKCHKLDELVLTTVRGTGVDASITNIQDVKKIMAYGVMTLPGLVIDREVKIADRIPSANELKTLIGRK